MVGSHRLGGRAFLLFLLKRIKLVLFFLVLTVLFWIEADALLGDSPFWKDIILKGLILLFLFVFSLRLVRTFFEYRGYSYMFDEEYFQVTQGYIIRNIIAIAYHQIQNVNIKRNILDRMMGVSQLIIVMSGINNKGEVDIVLPALDKEKAKVLQKEIMRRSRSTYFRHIENNKNKNEE